jgi:hypothetical protein
MGGGIDGEGGLLMCMSLLSIFYSLFSPIVRNADI